MNITEATRTQSLLAWAADPDPSPTTTAIAVVDARYLADRAHRVLGAGPDAQETAAALRRRVRATPCRAEPEDQGHAMVDGPDAEDAADRLARLAELLTPCPRPDAANGWDLCAHAEPWPCVITRAAWIAVGQRELDLDHVTDGPHTDDAFRNPGDATGDLRSDR